MIKNMARGLTPLAVPATAQAAARAAPTRAEVLALAGALELVQIAGRAKAARDPAEWKLPLPDAHCRYAGERTAAKLHWGGLSADQAGAGALRVYAEACGTRVVHCVPARSRSISRDFAPARGRGTRPQRRRRA
ncbi:hypothetical protein [Streptomyces sp. NPDC001774]